MGLFNQKPDVNDLPITSSFLETEGFVPRQISINSWREESGYLKTILDGKKKIRFHFVKVSKNEDSYLLYDPMFWYYSGYVQEFFENINTSVTTIGDYMHFINRAMLKMRIYERLCRRNKERLLKDVERQLKNLSMEYLEDINAGLTDAEMLIRNGIIQ